VRSPGQRSSFADERLITFEVAQALYGLPIAQVLEVMENAGVTCIPTLPRECGGVMNWHGEALPVVAPHLVLGCGAVRVREAGEEQPFLVVTDRPNQAACLGLPVDGVTGLVDAEPGTIRDMEEVVEMRSIDGTEVNVINPRRLVARVVQVFESAVA
jgi:chemotaxis signal transduction protein